MKSFVKRPSVAKASLVFIKNMQKQPFVMFFKIGVLKDFLMFTRKHLC